MIQKEVLEIAKGTVEFPGEVEPHRADFQNDDEYERAMDDHSDLIDSRTQGCLFSIGWAVALVMWYNEIFLGRAALKNARD